MSTENTNEKSYNDTEIVNYYSEFISAGLFHYEEMLIDKYFSAGGKTLDIGCGAGRVTIPLHERGFQVVGMDYAEKMIDVARALNDSIDYRVGDILSTQFAEALLIVILQYIPHNHQHKEIRLNISHYL